MSEFKGKEFLFDRFNSIQKISTTKAGPIAEWSELSDLDCGQGDLGSNPGKVMCFFQDGEQSGSHIACFHLW